MEGGDSRPCSRCRSGNTQGIDQQDCAAADAALKRPIVTLGERKDEQDQLFESQPRVGNHPPVDRERVAETLGRVHIRQGCARIGDTLLRNHVQQTAEPCHRRKLTAQRRIVHELCQSFGRRPSITVRIRARAMLAIVPDDLADALAAESRPSPNRIGARGKAQ